MQLLTLLMQIAVVLVAARSVGWVFRLLRQPQVVGEMAAGILLGPSLLGWLAPELSATLFPPESLGYLSSLSQIGLIVFMFLIGLELEPRLLRGRGHAALVTSHASIVVPFCLGALLALHLYPRLMDDSVSFSGFALFMGAAMSVTAFPVLARILTERNLLQTRLGTVTIACAAIDDISAWCILAIVVAIVRATDPSELLVTVLGSAAYLAIMLVFVRRGLRWLEAYYHRRGRLTQDMLAVVLLLVLVSAWATEWLGIHALFGAFAVGAVMPKDPGFVHDVMARLEDVVVVLLLPIFFAFAGLRTSIGLVQGAEMWGFFGLVMLVACAGKFGGSALAARTTGLSWRESGALGILMNTRGLMELVILGIGLELGAISPALYTIMVMMALVTTAMTTPILELIYPARQIMAERERVEDEAGVFTVMIPVALASAGPRLLEAAMRLVPERRVVRVYAVHFWQVEDAASVRAGHTHLPAEEEALRPLLDRAAELGIEVRPLSFPSRNLSNDLRDLAKVKRADLILMGWNKPLIGNRIMSPTVSAVLREVSAEVAILIDRGTAPWRRVLVPYRDMVSDSGALAMASRIAGQAETEVTILHIANAKHASRAEEEAHYPTRARRKHVEHDDPLEAVVAEAACGYELVVVGVSRAWGTASALPPSKLLERSLSPLLELSPFGHRHEALARTQASILVVRPNTLDKRTSATKREAA
jgi:Kef-type K+ transport system membrane component KefB